MKTVITLVLLTISGSNLAFAQIGVVQQPLATSSKTLWPANTINVCWENPTATDVSQRTVVRNAVRDTWEKESSVRFVGWNTCTDASQGIRILINDSQPHVKKLGRGLNGMRNGMVLNFSFNNWSTGCTRNPNACIGPIAVHEFGHALGFSHEQNRADCRCNDSPQGNDGDWFVSPCDINSVMMYCNPNWNNNGQLSGYDIMGVRKLYGDPNGFTTVFDESGKIEVTVFSNATGSREQHSDLRITVPNDYLVIGGGARATNLGSGALLTSSYPSTDMRSWLVSSKDHIKPQPHILTGYAIGLKVRGFSREQLKANIIIKQVQSSVTNHPTATATLPDDYLLLGGGFKVNWQGVGNLATASYPSGNSWTAKSKDHDKPSNASIITYAIGIKKSIVGLGTLENSVFSGQSDMEGHPSIAVPIERGFVLTGGGGEVKYSGSGNLLWQLVPNATDSNNQKYEVSSKDHGVPSNAYIIAHAIGLKLVLAR